MRRREGLSNHRDQWLQHWEDLARYMLPRRAGFVTQFVPGERRTEEIFDGTAMQAARGLANAAFSMMMPEGDQWLFIRTADDELGQMDAVREWIDRAEERQINAMYNPRARFRESIGEALLDLVVFGTAVIFIGRSRELDHLTYQTLHLKDTLIGYSDEGNPDTIFREHRYTVRQAAQKFGEDKLSDALKQRLKNNSGIDERVSFDHVVTPRSNGDDNSLLARNMAFAELWIERDAENVVAEGGFREFPFAVPRWDTSSDEDYGRSPGMIAFPDAATSQAMGETILVAGQRAANPPLFAPNDGAFDAVNMFPGGISYYDVETATQLRGNPFFPLDTGLNLPIGRDMQQDTREQIRQAFFRNVFNLPVPGTDMTATEVIERKEEFIREVGPVFGRLESDLNGPVAERSFNIMLRSGAFDPIPEELQGTEVRFEFESPVKKIRHQTQAQAAQLWAQEIIGLAQVKPEALDLLNVDELARFSAEALNLPESIVVGREAIQALREQRAQAQAEAMEREKVAQEAQIAGQAATAAKDAAPVLQQIMGGGGAQGDQAA